MEVNPYQSPGNGSEQPGSGGESPKQRRLRRLISLGGFTLLFYNAYLAVFVLYGVMEFTLQVFDVVLPEAAEAGCAIALCSTAAVGAMGNGYVLCLLLRLLAAQPEKYGPLRRLCFAFLVFVPIWGRHWYRRLLADRFAET